ncbi:AbrB family transcriptional regulator [Pseudoroseicyclus aestuarii]|nr:AbrB family transcriptional regulator [Pseudoroseicyclus aestuarii]
MRGRSAPRFAIPADSPHPRPAAPGPAQRGLRWAGLIALAALAAGGLERAGLPAALLLGPMLVAIGFGLGGAKLAIPRPLFSLCQALVGCMIAQSLSLSVLQEVGRDWPIFALGVTSVIAAGFASGWVLARLEVLPGSTAIWGSAPGAASAMVLMCGDFGADMRLVAFMQYTRVLIVALLAALVAHLATGGAGQGAEAVDWLAVPDWPGLAATLALALGSVLLGRWLPIPGAALLLPLIGGAVLEGTGVIEIVLPQPLLALAYACVGIGVGLRFDRAVTGHALRALPRILAAIACLVALCGLMAGALVVFAGIDPLSAYLATSPGGADTVAIIASATDVDVAFVMAMQMARFLLILITGPTLARMVARRFGS